MTEATAASHLGCPAPHPSTTTEVFDEGELAAVVFDGRINRAYRFNSSASAVWLLLDGTAAAEEIGRELASTFEIGESESRKGVNEAIVHFTSLGLLKGSDSAPAERVREVASQILDRLPDP